MRIATSTQFSDQLNTLTDQMMDLQTLNFQAHGEKLQNSSDDPVLADQINSINDFISQLGDYDISSTLAKNRTQLFSDSLKNVTGYMNQVTELVQYAKSDTLSNEDRQNVATQLQGLLSRMLQVGNTQQGQTYIFSGYATDTPSFVQVNGTYQYQGSMDASVIDIGVNVSTIYNDSGYNVFGNISNGNGSFTVAAPASNTGTGYTSAGSVISNGAYVADTYTITFVDTGGGQMGYQVVGAQSGQVIPPPPQTVPADAPLFESGMALTFNGISLNVNGNPNIGDTFQLAPSTNENVFNMLQDLINTLNTPVDATIPAQQAAFHQAITQESASLTEASSYIRSYLSQVGTRGADIDSQIQLNSSTITQQKSILGSLAGSNMEEVISDISQKNMEIQTTAGVYLKIQNMLLDLMKSMSM